MKVNILGAEWTICELTEAEDSLLLEMDGYCDKTLRRIVISKPSRNCSLGDYQVYRKKIIRHEIIHAFLYESGLWENFEHPKWGHDEAMIDWIAVQFPKMYKVFQEVGCL